MPISDIDNLVKSMNFQSESDSGLVYTYQASLKHEICYRTLQLMLGRTLSEDKLEEIDVDVWFNHQIAVQPQTYEFETLFDLITENMFQTRVYRLPSITEGFNIDYVIVGFNYFGRITTIITHAVET
jgi:nuclease A inhibitor-like protein